MKWFVKVLRQYNDFQGRARRKEYFMFALFNGLFAGAIMIIAFILNSVLDTPAFMALYGLYLLVTLVPSLAVGVRRLHDIGKSGWMLLVGCIPFIGGFWLLILMLTDSQPEANVYGENPKLGSVSAA
ncbi:Uncharacterized membrane protein YhaH, DUF805 family [Pustulibacterium marinum]|uniref:Uncharacterized membrane protein YhaH, DUF805 family n=1 Tax=Pustulibacterium marinum TaxID=1224947 RepID=A0A1I7GA39_9FLAO|nr:DUF805 domain-containing protein [Pustulibacterium marinum]SFU45325.1 Uncharacterized membrane protein YhaH, DUF805 family [Pustulibacterium marinum]